MPYSIKIATSPAECDAVMRLRYDVFVDERGFMPERRDRRVFDHYDALPTTANLLASLEGSPVGTLRYTAPSEAGTAPSSFFDFAPHLPVPLEDVGALGQMVICGGTRQGAEIAFALLGMGYCLAREENLRYLDAIVNPDALGRMLVTTGWVTASEEFTDPSGLRCLPLTLDLDALHGRFAEFVTEHRSPALRAGAEYRFYSRDETILRSGRSAGNPLAILKGTVALRTDAGEDLGKLGPGARVDESRLESGAVAIAAGNVSLMATSWPSGVRQPRGRRQR